MSRRIKAGPWLPMNPWRRTRRITGGCGKESRNCVSGWAAGIVNRRCITRSARRSACLWLSSTSAGAARSTPLRHLEAELQSLAGERVLADERAARSGARGQPSGGGCTGIRRTTRGPPRSALEARQTGRGSIESRLQEARDRLTGLHANRAEAQARLDALAAQLEYHAARIATTTESLRSAGEATAGAEQGWRKATASKGRDRTPASASWGRRSRRPRRFC